MDTNKYLNSVLKSQTLASNSNELVELRKKRDEVENILREAFEGADLTIRYGGSHAKNTMIKANYDLDLTCHFGHEETQAGKTLAEIYHNVYEVLSDHYLVEKKRSALRLEEVENSDDEDAKSHYIHVDVVPGRFTNDQYEDVFLHQNEGDKDRLKTNLNIHISHIGDSGLTDTIKLVKYWRERSGRFDAKTFVLELLVVEILTDFLDCPLDEQLITFWETLRDNIEDITIKDPANPEGNDLSEIFNDQVKSALSYAAEATLQTIEESGWEEVFGDPSEENEGKETVNRIVIPSSRTVRTKPWASYHAPEKKQSGFRRNKRNT